MTDTTARPFASVRAIIDTLRMTQESDEVRAVLLSRDDIADLDAVLRQMMLRVPAGVDPPDDLTRYLILGVPPSDECPMYLLGRPLRYLDDDRWEWVICP